MWEPPIGWEGRSEESFRRGNTGAWVAPGHGRARNDASGAARWATGRRRRQESRQPSTRAKCPGRSSRVRVSGSFETCELPRPGQCAPSRAPGNTGSYLSRLSESTEIELESQPINGPVRGDARVSIRGTMVCLRIPGWEGKTARCRSVSQSVGRGLHTEEEGEIKRRRSEICPGPGDRDASVAGFQAISSSERLPPGSGFAQ